MPKQSPIINLYKKVVAVLGRDLPITDNPEGVTEERAFYEGIIACGQTKTCQNLTKNPYTKGSDHYLSWSIGWDYATPIIKTNLVIAKQQRELNHPFLKEAV